MIPISESGDDAQRTLEGDNPREGVTLNTTTRKRIIGGAGRVALLGTGA